MSLPLLIIYLVVLGLIGLAGFVAVGGMRTRGHIARALNMSLFLVTLPRENTDTTQQQRPDKELIAVMEQLYTSFTNIHAKGWNKFLYGEPYIGLEMSVHHVGEEIHFYVAVPRSYKQIFEKQVHGLYPHAEVEKVRDYNIFNTHGATAGTYALLKEQAILPFKTYTKLESDPLGELATALSKISAEGEGASIQMLIRPSHDTGLPQLAQRVAKEMQMGKDFQKALSLAKKGGSSSSEKDGQTPEPTRSATPFEDEVIKSLQSKSSRPLFDVNLRVLVSAADEQRADQLLNDVTGAFVQFSAPSLNTLQFVKVSGRALEELSFAYSFRLFDDDRIVRLSSEEVTSIFHFPLPTTRAARIKSVRLKMAEPPADLPQEGIQIGISKFRGEEKPVRLTESDRRRHLYVVGQTGTGKSTFMKQMLAQDIQQGKGVCIIDPHGEFAEYVLSVIPKERAEDVVYFNPGDTERPVGLNMLEIDPAKPEQKTFVANELLSIIKSVYKGNADAFGPMFEQYFKNSILLLLDDYVNEIPTLAHIPRVLADDKYRKDKLSRETNPLVKNFWEQEAEKAGGEAALANMVPYITSKLNPFLANDYVRPIVAQQASAINFREVMDQQKILIVNLSKGRIGEINANLLGMIVVGKLLMAALSRVDIADENQRKDFYLYIDEFQTVTTDSIATILSEARKYRLDLVIANQYIKQIQENIRDAVFGNVGSMVAFRVGPDDAEYLKNKFEPVFSSQDLMSIDNFNAHVRLLINNQNARPFNIQTVKESEGSAQMLEAIKEISRLKYGRPREEVEQEIKNYYAS